MEFYLPLLYDLDLDYLSYVKLWLLMLLEILVAYSITSLSLSLCKTYALFTLVPRNCLSWRWTYLASGPQNWEIESSLCGVWVASAMGSQSPAFFKTITFPDLYSYDMTFASCLPSIISTSLCYFSEITIDKPSNFHVFRTPQVLLVVTRFKDWIATLIMYSLQSSDMFVITFILENRQQLRS